MTLRPISQYLGRDGREIITGDPADAPVAHWPDVLIIDDALTREKVFHEHMWVEMAPSDATALDVALNQLMPSEVWVGRAAISEHAEVNNEAHACVGCRVGDRLDLMYHVDRVAAHHEHPVDPCE